MSNLASPRGNERIKTCAIYTRFYIAVNSQWKEVPRELVSRDGAEVNVLGS